MANQIQLSAKANEQLALIPNYITGKAFVERLLAATGLTSIGEASRTFNVPVSTINTWINHERISYELAIRVHLVTGVPIEELVLNHQKGTVQ